MSWEPKFEDVEDELQKLNGLKPTFEQYAQQEDYGLKTLRPKNVKLDVDEDVYNEETDSSTLRADARAELELQAYYRKLGNPNKKHRERKWHEQQDDVNRVETEMSNMMRMNGMEREPASDYRPNSEATSKSAIPHDKLPVPGVKNLFLTDDHFMFQNPYVKTPARSKQRITEERKSNCESESENANACTTSTSSKFHKESSLGVAGEQYVSPAQLYFLKARRNR